MTISKYVKRNLGKIYRNSIRISKCGSYYYHARKKNRICKAYFIVSNKFVWVGWSYKLEQLVKSYDKLLTIRKELYKKHTEIIHQMIEEDKNRGYPATYVSKNNSNYSITIEQTNGDMYDLYVCLYDDNTITFGHSTEHLFKYPSMYSKEFCYITNRTKTIENRIQLYVKYIKIILEQTTLRDHYQNTRFEIGNFIFSFENSTMRIYDNRENIKISEDFKNGKIKINPLSIGMFKYV